MPAANEQTIWGKHIDVGLLSTFGLENLIAPTPNDYLALAVALAQDSARLTALRPMLRNRMAQSSLCDGRKFAAEIEGVYRSIWREWCETTRKQTPQGD